MNVENGKRGLTQEFLTYIHFRVPMHLPETLDEGGTHWEKEGRRYKGRETTGKQIICGVLLSVNSLFISFLYLQSVLTPRI